MGWVREGEATLVLAHLERTQHVWCSGLVLSSWGLANCGKLPGGEFHGFRF